MRSIFTFALAVILTALLWTIFSSAPTHAADAAWSGDAIVYDGHGYTKNADFTDATGTIPDGATVYTAPVQTDGSASTADRKMLVLYFSSGVDPPTATQAQYVEFTYNGTTTSNPQAQKTVAITAQGLEDESTSCSVSGVGWFICPVSVFLAEAMDNIFNFLADLIRAQPLVIGDSSNSMYVAWNIMRSIANIAFVIAFLIIIFSQVTNLGVGSYGLKKLTPRLIVAAVLVNVSFIICAIAVDISNILGYSIQDIFIMIREDVFYISNDNFSGVNNNPWTAVTAVVLAGGGVIGGVYYMAAGGLYMLIPILIGVALTALFVLVILAARQAIIVILVIISPLAFVANLLPNTEKWFDKWKDLFMTMLIFFPAFSLVFGGSQLAGQLIIQNAGDNIVTVIFGMAVQIAPLVITPLLLKLSGGLLGRIAQIANNPRKGVMDRSNNWAERRAEHAKYQNLAKGPRLRNPASWGTGMVRGLNDRKQSLEERTSAYKQGAKNRYEQTKRHHKNHELQEGYDLDKEAVHGANAAHIEHLKAPGGRLYDRNLSAEAGKAKAEAARNVTAHHVNQQRVLGGAATNAAAFDLHQSSYRLETSKERLAASESFKNTYYNDERVRVGSSLNAASYGAEVNKSRLEASDAAKNAYFTNERATSGTRLNATVDPLETSKVRLEAAQSRYATTVEQLKVAPGSTLNGAMQTSLATKDAQETAVNTTQAYVDTQRRTVGTALNQSTIRLEESKLSAESSKNLTAAYIAAEKLAVGSDLHLEVVRSEQAKLAGQLGESRVSKMVEEYKSGRLVRTGELNTLMTTMVDDVEYIAAETQGVQAAKNIQTENVANAFTAKDASGANTARAQELLRTAASVDHNGDVRAESNALSMLDDITNKARSANESLIEDRAVGMGLVPKAYAAKLLEDRMGGDTSQSDDLIRAAMEIAGKEALIPLIRDMRMADPALINQDHLTAMLLRNSTTMKVKGGFDLQASQALIGANWDTMHASTISTMGSSSPEQLKDVKNGAFKDYAQYTEEMVDSVDTLLASSDANDRKNGKAGLEGILKTYQNLTIALKDPEIVRALGDNLAPAIRMHRRIHNSHYGDPAMAVDYSTIDPKNLADDDDLIGKKVRS